MTIYIVETPHQRAPICWVAKNEADVINKISLDSWAGEGLPEDATFDEALAANAADLSSQRVFLSTDEAAAALGPNDTFWGNHRFVEARAALYKEVIRYSWDITDPAIRATFEN